MRLSRRRTFPGARRGDEKVVVAHETPAVGADAREVGEGHVAGRERGAKIRNRRVDEVATLGRTEVIDDADAHGLPGAGAEDQAEKEKDKEKKRAAHVGQMEWTSENCMRKRARVPILPREDENVAPA